MGIMNIFFVIPAFNEEKSIVNVIRDLKNNNYNNIIVVDDGSKDKTYELASNEKVIVLRHIINRGQGAALKTGICYALRNYADVIVTFDADGQHDVNDIKRLIDPILSKRADVTLGSRFLDITEDLNNNTNNKSSAISKRHSNSTKTNVFCYKSHCINVPFFRKIFLKGGAFLIWLMYGIKLTDSHNGLRALSRNAAELIDIKSDGMAHASEILEQIKKKNLSFIEIPVNIKYTEYSLSHGQKTLDAFKIFYRMIINRFLR